ncbi:MAG: hypothetical protein LBT89_07705 [Planctomycetaceae bacterium]|jgi:hypothetical protein|nr:hypothetical protein [Planctomycetaceae bacterium]
MTFTLRLIGVLVLAALFLVNKMPAQTLPPLTYTTVRNLTIPFELRAAGGADPIKEVELLVSQDRGRRWYSVKRLPVDAKRFAFTAAGDGEYWFAFRTVSESGNISVTPSGPQLRVAVGTASAAPTELTPPPKQPGEQMPLTPPKPEKFRPVKAETDIVTNTADTNVTKKTAETYAAANPSAAMPMFPDLDVIPNPAPAKNDDDSLDGVFNNMASFFDIQPAKSEAKVGGKIAAGKSAAAVPAVSTQDTLPAAVQSGGEAKPIQAGKINSLGWIDSPDKPQIVVHWNTGDELWQDAQIDILRGTNKDGPWLPISINLPNKGEYWWYLTEEDKKPFFVAVRIRSIHGGTQTDSTPKAIDIASKEYQ